MSFLLPLHVRFHLFEDPPDLLVRLEILADAAVDAAHFSHVELGLPDGRDALALADARHLVE